MRFEPIYFVIFVLLLAIEICIAVFVQEGFVRHFLGDVLVVILIYCFLQSFFKINTFKAALLVLAFAFIIEFLQLVKLVDRLAIEDDSVLQVILGNTFDFRDLVAYTIGITIILLTEYRYYPNSSNN